MKLNAVGILFAVTASALIRSGKAFGFRGHRFKGLKHPVVSKSAREPSEGWITQPVDHFNTRDNRTWSMRYYENDQFLSGPDAPILIMLGGEWEIETDLLQTGTMYDIGSTHGAMLYYTEHRYYGQSYPVGNMSTENLQFLSVDQALADVAYFIEAKKKERNLENSEVVVFGGSYAGNMAAWARIKYPHLIKGALASSAPVFAKVHFSEYFEGVTNGLSRYNPQCSADVNQAVLDAEELLQSPTTAKTLKEYFNLCDDIVTSSSQDVGNFMSTLADVFAEIVQYNLVYSNGTSDISIICDVMTATDLGSPLQRLAYYMNSSECLDAGYNSLVEMYTNVNWNSSAATSAMRSWYYQTCTEFGYWQTTTSDNSVFGTLVSLEFYIQLCKDLYGVEFYDENLSDRSVERTNIMYGGRTPDVTNVIFTNGDIDPWHVLSILEDVNEFSPAILVPGGSHYQDLDSADPSTDSAELAAAKARVRQIVGGWIS